MDRAPTLTEQLRDWYEHSPKAQRAYARLSADVSAVSAWATPKAEDLWHRVAPRIDPSSKPAPDDRVSGERETGAPPS